MKFSGLVIILLLLGCQINKNDNPIESLLSEDLLDFENIFDNPEKYRLQILYTQVERNFENQPLLKTFTYRANSKEYFYPASTVKLPGAIAALEKLNAIKVDGLDMFTTMVTDSAYSRQTSVRFDATSETGYPSIAHYIKRVFLVSDNDAYNRLYEFIGQKELNECLWNKGYDDVRLTHRLSVFRSPEENRYTNPVSFITNYNLIYSQPLAYNDSVISAPEPIMLGKGVMVGDSVEMHPKDFSGSNYISLHNLHEVLINIIFPGTIHSKKPFNLTNQDYDFLYKYMSMLPRESESPYYGKKYPDNYCKFLMYADDTGTIPTNIRIFNKIGLAYGFLIDVAYIIDLQNNLEFFLSAVIYVNKNDIFNDGQYEYDSVGFPFMGSLGRAFYNYELNREREYTPDLKRFRSIIGGAGI